MDWMGFDMPVNYEIDFGPVASPWPNEWLALLPIALLLATVALVLVARRPRRSFSCPVAGRDVVVEFRRGRVRSCTAFETPKAIACARRCIDAGFRRQWPPALPVLVGGAKRSA